MSKKILALMTDKAAASENCNSSYYISLLQDGVWWLYGPILLGRTNVNEDLRNSSGHAEEDP